MRMLALWVAIRMTFLRYSFTLFVWFVSSGEGVLRKILRATDTVVKDAYTVSKANNDGLFSEAELYQFSKHMSTISEQLNRNSED